MKKTLALICTAAALALPASAHALTLPTFALPDLSMPDFLTNFLHKATPIDAEFTALVREVEMARARSQRFAVRDPVAKVNEKFEIAELTARLDRGPALSKEARAHIIEQARQASRQRYQSMQAEFRAPEPTAETLAGVAPVYARYYTLKQMRELAIALNPPFNGKAVDMNEGVVDQTRSLELRMAKARNDEFARRLDALRPPLPVGP